MGAKADDGLTDDQRKKLQQLQKKKELSRSEREEKNIYLGIQAKKMEITAGGAAEERRMAAEIEAKKAAAQQAEYERQVSYAERRRQEERDKDKSFKDSDVGKIYEKTGGFTPMLMGVAAGGIQRAAAGPGKTAFQKYGLPAAEGAGFTFAGLNAPLFYDAYNAPVRNPEKAASEAYARELPETHPLKAKLLAEAQAMSDENPVYRRAWDSMTSLPETGKRAFAATVEGAPAGVFGANLPGATKAAIRGIGSIPGLLMEGAAKQSAATNVARSAAQGARSDAALSRQVADEAERGISQPKGGLLDDVAAQKPKADLMGDPATVPPPAPQRPPPQPEPVQSQKALPAPGGPDRPTPWATKHTSAATAAIKEFMSENPGVSMEALSAPRLRTMMQKHLPPGVEVPSDQLIRKRLKEMRDRMPKDEPPSMKAFLAIQAKDPYRKLLPAIGAGGLGMGLLGEWPGDGQ